MACADCRKEPSSVSVRRGLLSGLHVRRSCPCGRLWEKMHVPAESSLMLRYADAFPEPTASAIREEYHEARASVSRMLAQS